MSTAAQLALAVAGPLVHAGSWVLVGLERVPLWVASGTTMAILGVLAALVGPVGGATRVDRAAAIWLGLGAGVLLYVATVAFMTAARRVPIVARQTAAVYAESPESANSALFYGSVMVSAVGEELLWRGVVLGVLARSLGSTAGGAVASWAGFVAVNALSRRIPIVLAAVVGGAAWTGLAWWTGGVIASIECHLLWSALMVVLPPPGARR
jgi:membrane protease YdiL (CAAX protease family)